ncbi:MAG: xanthine phosphoribosyltransferase [Clostridia bacterium]|nr:xanthine phosphoribosyltransferase [Clostridia bacterium]
MEELRRKIESDGKLLNGGVVIVSGFLNHRMDINLIDNIGREFFRLFSEKRPTLILTVEASGIGIACMAARYFGVDVLFAKKKTGKNVTGAVFTSEVRSFTKGVTFSVSVDRNYISADDRVLIIDDFLAAGEASFGMIDICRQAGAEVCGIGICIEKSFQPGGAKLREAGYDLRSLAVVDLGPDGKMTVRG